MSTVNWGEVAAFIDGAGLAHVATASASGHPHVAVVFVAREDDHLLLTMRSTSGKASNLRTNRRIAVMWQGNSAETYVWGTATLVTDEVEKARIWNSGLFPFDLGQFYAGPATEDWLIADISPERAVAMVQTATGLERRTWRE